jgi:hypothetical protein
MTNVTRALHKPKLLLEIVVRRRPHLRRFSLLLLLILVSAAAWFALEQAGLRADLNVDGRALEIGKLVAALIILLASIRAVINLVRWRTHPDEMLRFFNRGFSRERGGEKVLYAWDKLQSFREANHGIYLGQRPVVQWGALTLTMSDQRVFKLRPRHGDLRKLAKVIRPFAAEITGIRMGRQLRQETPVRVHPAIVVWPGGLQVKKNEYPWKDLSVAVRGSQLVIRARQQGKVRTVGRFATSRVENLGGFMELATTTIRNHR